jgi:GT2 family glycosyltransferase
MSSTKPLVSLVILTHNDIEHLILAIEIALAQTWPDTEIIVVDDASDQPVEPRIRATFAMPHRITVIRREVNGGVVVASQDGLDRAKGAYVHLGSTNDPIEPEFIEASVRMLEQRPDIAICFSDPGIIFGWDGRHQTYPLHLAHTETFFSPDEISELMRARPFHISSNTVLIRTEAFRKFGGCRAALGLYADWFVWIVAALANGAAYIPRTLTYFRIHAGAFSDMERWDKAARTAYARATLQTVAAEFPELAPRFRRSLVASHFGVGVLLALLRDAQFRALLGGDVLRMAMMRRAWALLRAMLPFGGSQWVRRIAMAGRKSS